MATPEKVQVVEELSNLLGSAKGVYLTDFTGLSVEQMQDLRRKCRKEQIEYRVVKRTLLQLAARGSGLPALDTGLSGPCGLVVSMTDQVAPARVLSDFAKTNDKLKIRLGLIDGKAMGEADVKVLASLPTKDVLQANLLGVFQAPMASLLSVFEAGPAALLSVMEQRGESKGAGSGAADAAPSSISGEGDSAAAPTPTTDAPAATDAPAEAEAPAAGAAPAEEAPAAEVPAEDAPAAE